MHSDQQHFHDNTSMDKGCEMVKSYREGGAGDDTPI